MDEYRQLVENIDLWKLGDEKYDILSKIKIVKRETHLEKLFDENNIEPSSAIKFSQLTNKNLGFLGLSNMILFSSSMLKSLLS